MKKRMKQNSIIVSIITAIILLLSLNISNGATGSIYLSLKGKSTARATGTYEFNNKAVFKIKKTISIFPLRALRRPPGTLSGAF